MWKLAAGGAVFCWLAVVVIMPVAALAADAGKESRAGQAEVRPKASQPTALPRVPEGVLLQRDVAYLAADRNEKLDLYLPVGRRKSLGSPAVVIIHGGGWTGGSKSASREFNIGTTLAKVGYVCASVEYLKEGAGHWPTNLYDCKNAVRFLRKNAKRYQVDVDHLGVIGGSAGGHLALMVAYTHGVRELTPDSPYPGISDQVQCCVDLYGPTDRLTRQSTAADGTPNGQLHEAGLFSDPRGENPEKWKLASPVYYVAKDSPPTLILHGSADTTVDREQSVELDRKLTQLGVEHQLILLPGIGHTFDLQQWQHTPLPQDLRPVVVGFFDQHLKSSQQKVRSPQSQ